MSNADRIKELEAENKRLLLALTRVSASCSQLLDALQGPGDAPTQSEVDERCWNARKAIREAGAATEVAPKADRPKVPPFKFSESDEPSVGDPVKANNRKRRTKR